MLKFSWCLCLMCCCFILWMIFWCIVCVEIVLDFEFVEIGRMCLEVGVLWEMYRFFCLLLEVDEDNGVEGEEVGFIEGGFCGCGYLCELR